MLVNVTNTYAVPQVQIPEFIHFLLCISSSVHQKAFKKIIIILKHIPNIPTSPHFHCTSFQPWSPFNGSPVGAFHFISASTLICHRRQPNASPLESVPLSIFGKDLPISKPSPESTAWPSWISADLIELYLFCCPMPPVHPLLLWHLWWSISQTQIPLKTLFIPSFTFTGLPSCPSCHCLLHVTWTIFMMVSFLTGSHSFLWSASNLCTCVFHGVH